MAGRENNQEKGRRRVFADTVDKKVERRRRAERERDRGVWFGLGMMGVVGWTVAIPTLIGLAIGVWIDSSTSSRYSWTLTCMFVGIVAGCAMAWRWVRRESEDDK